MTTEPRDQDARPDDRGSVMPLVLGMVIGVLLLGAGVTAATSAFLAHQGLQHACDGAAAASADATLSGYYDDRTGPDPAAAARAATDYLRPRHSRVVIDASTTADAVELTCTRTSPITMGALFGVADLTQSVHAVGRVAL